MRIRIACNANATADKRRHRAQIRWCFLSRGICSDTCERCILTLSNEQAVRKVSLESCAPAEISVLLCMQCVGAAPACVTPRKKPDGAARFFAGHKIQAGGAPGLAAQQSCERHPTACPQSKSGQGFIRIFRTGRQMATVEPDQRGEGVAIDLHQRAAGLPRCPCDTMRTNRTCF